MFFITKFVIVKPCGWWQIFRGKFWSRSWKDWEPLTSCTSCTLRDTHTRKPAERLCGKDWTRSGHSEVYSRTEKSFEEDARVPCIYTYIPTPLFTSSRLSRSSSRAAGLDGEKSALTRWKRNKGEKPAEPRDPAVTAASAAQWFFFINTLPAAGGL